MKCSTNCLTINPVTEHQESWMAGAIQALCRVWDSHPVSAIHLHWDILLSHGKQQKIPPTPLRHTLTPLGLKTLEKKNPMCFLYMCMWLEKENCRVRTDVILQALSHCYHKASAIMCNKSYNLLSRLFILYLFSNISGVGANMPQTCSNSAVKQRANIVVETMTVPRLACRFYELRCCNKLRPFPVNSAIETTIQEVRAGGGAGRGGRPKPCNHRASYFFRAI